MTTLNIDLRTPSPAGRQPSTGRLAWQRVERLVDGAVVVLPAETSVPLVAGQATAELDPGYYWFTEKTTGGVRALRLVPSVGPVAYADLPALDSATMEPTAEPEAAWYGYVQTLEAVAQAAADSASGSETSAAGSATTAQLAADDAEDSSVAASGYATAAGNSATAAAGSATAAAGSATTAAGHVTAAAQPVTNATTQAAAAAGSATAAAGSAVAAANSKDAAAISASAAESTRTSMVVSGAVDVNGHLQLSRVAAAPVDAGYVAGPPVSLTIGEVETGPDTPGTPGPIGLTGAKGDPGGITFGTLIGTSTDWNTLTTDGVYRAAAAAGANMPANGTYGTLIVTGVEASGARILQTFYPAQSSLGGRYIQARVFAVGAWQPWRLIPSQRVDQSAGRAIYTWDDLNSREQLVYGDTGSRQIAADAAAFTGNLRLRRVGSTVFLRAAALYVGASPASATAVLLNTWPTGFTPDLALAIFQSRNMTDGTIGNIRITNTQLMNYTAQAANGNLEFAFSWLTLDPWPTTLPGTAAGSIPNL